MERGIPLVFLNIIITWYNGLCCQVKWGNSYSIWFDINAGVRQGGILSPDLYSIYVDDLIQKLKSLNIGCHFKGIFAAGLFYADDMAILAPSVKALRLLLEICEQYCLKWDIGLNAKKSKNMHFGRKCKQLCDIFLNGSKVEWVESWV